MTFLSYYWKEILIAVSFISTSVFLYFKIYLKKNEKLVIAEIERGNLDLLNKATQEFIRDTNNIAIKYNKLRSSQNKRPAKVSSDGQTSSGKKGLKKI